MRKERNHCFTLSMMLALGIYDADRICGRMAAVRDRLGLL